MTQEDLHSTPGWVKVFGIVAAVLAALIVVVLFAGGGRHGPGRHMPAASGGDTPLSNVTKDAPAGDRLLERAPPKGGH